MTTFTWKVAAGGNYDTSGDWDQPGAPGAADMAVLPGFAGGAYTVAVTSNNTITTLQTAANAALSVTGSTFTDTAGGTNAGTIAVGDYGTFTAGGTFTNSGIVSLVSYNPAHFIVATNMTLTGAGQVILVDNAYATSNALYGATAATTLTNVDNTISGAGALGSGQLILINQAAGVIDANGASHQLVLNTGSNAVSNAGLIEATGAAGLSIQSTVIDNGTSGVVEGAGATVYLNSATIVGGFLKTTGAGVIQAVGASNLLDGTLNAVNNQGYVNIGDNSTLNLKGILNNTGSLVLNSYNPAHLVIAANTTLTGAGHILLQEGAYALSNAISGATATTTLTNVDNTISGAGQLGIGQLTLTNSVAGVIDATGSSNQLVLNTGASVVTNAGLIEATGAAGLLIQATKISNGTTGVILANNSVVKLQSADLIGGLLESSNGGSIQTTDRGSQLDGTTTAKFYELGNLVVANSGTSLTLQGSIYLTRKVGTTVTNGTITVDSYNPSQIIIGAKGAYIAGSQIKMLEGAYAASNQIIGTLTGGTTPRVSRFTNNSLIVGAGNIGLNMILVNGGTGVIDATGSSHALVIATGNSTVAQSNIVQNYGLLESTSLDPTKGVGGLLISNTVIANLRATAVVEANGANTHVDLQTATIVGGTLKTLAGGVIQTLDRGSILDGSTLISGLAAPVVNKATIIIANNGTSLSLKGAITNNGAFSLTSYNPSQLIMATNTILSGGGTVTLNDNAYGASNQIFGATATTSLTNVDNTISGAGALGNGQLTLVNDASGVIDATGATNQLVINTGAIAVSNAGRIEATSAQGLRISNTTISNTGAGSIKTLAGSHIDLLSATITGGTLASTGSGYFQTLDRGSILDGSTAAVNDQATIVIANNGTSLSLKGAINNTGVFSLTSYNPSQLVIATNTTLTGSGAIILNDGGYGGSNQIFGASSTTSLTNNGNTISGAGQLGNGQLTLVNGALGVIDATGTSNALVINTGTVMVSNAGLIESTASAGLVINSAISNTGAIKASGGNVTLSGTVTGSGVDSILGASQIEAAAADSNNVTFDSASTGTFKLDQSQSYSGTITGLATGKTVDLANIAIATAHIVSYSNNTLTVTDGTTTSALNLSGNYNLAYFHLSADSTNHTDVTYSGSGLAVSPAVSQMVSAMAAMGAGAGGSGFVTASPAPVATTTLLSFSHAA